jgi:hypothetical protein
VEENETHMLTIWILSITGVKGRFHVNGYISKNDKCGYISGRKWQQDTVFDHE